MTHMVIFRSTEGKPCHHQAESLDDAVRFAERLRNEESVGDARIFRMAEVAIEFRTYYRAEVVGPVSEPPVIDDVAVLVASDLESAGSGGRFGLFSRAASI